jgi:hypothetical protein
MEKNYKVIHSNPTNHIYDKLLCDICKETALRCNFSNHKKGKKHVEAVEYNKNGLVARNDKKERVYLQPLKKTKNDEELVIYDDLPKNIKKLLIDNIDNIVLDNQQKEDINTFINTDTPMYINYLDDLLELIKTNPIINKLPIHYKSPYYKRF